MLTQKEKLKRLDHFINRMKKEIEKRQQEINRFNDSIKIGYSMINELMIETNKTTDYESEKGKIKDCKPDEYEQRIKAICDKLGY